MSKTDIGSSSAAQYTRSFENLRGIDLSTDASQIHRLRCPHLVNMYRDYDAEHGAAIETIPGYRRLFHFDGKIHGIWGYASTQDDDQIKHIVVHAGTKIYTFKVDERDSGKYELRYSKLADAKSTAFLQNNNFYICDGTGIYVMAADFSVKSIEEVAYTPITYLHGAPYEQRNMITDRFVNRDTAISEDCSISEIRVEDALSSPDDDDWLEYLSYFFEPDPDTGFPMEKTMTVEGYTKNHPYYGRRMGEVEVLPVFFRFSSEGYYNVLHIYDDEFEGRKDDTYLIQYDPEFAKDIERVIVLSSSLNSASEAYYKEQFPKATEIVCAGDFVRAKECKAYLYDPCMEVTSVKVNDEEILEFNKAKDQESTPKLWYAPVSEIVTEDGEDKRYISFIRILASKESDIDAKIVDIAGVADAVNFNTAEKLQMVHTDYVTANKEYKGTAKEAILGCGISATFDGRVFLTGNKNLPNTVFYSCRDLTGYNNPAYYGVYNYFNDGEGNEPNVALLSTTSVLMVLKRNTIQGSAIYYHTAADGIDDVVPRIYPSTPGVAGLGCEGPAMNFLDDAVFLSERGLEGLSKQQLNLERTIGHRSSCVDRRMTRNDLSKASMCRYKGYLCIFDGTGAVYLADSNQLFQGVDGSAEYEWFYLDGIGDYEGDSGSYTTVTEFTEVYPLDGSDPITLEGATDVFGNPFRITSEGEEVSENEIYTEELDVKTNGIKVKVRVQYTERYGCLYLCEAVDDSVAYVTMTEFTKVYPLDGSEPITLNGATDTLGRPFRITSQRTAVLEEDIRTEELDVKAKGEVVRVRVQYTERNGVLYPCEAVKDSVAYATMTEFTKVYPLDGSEPITLNGTTDTLGRPFCITSQKEAVLEEDICDEALDIKMLWVKVRVQYTIREDGLYLCEKSGERVGGVFSPSCVGFSLGDMLFFGTESGSICCFNMDKRNEDPFNDGWVAIGTIHPSYYSFVGHRYRSELSLISDNCGAPHLTKRTSRKTCVAKLKNMRGSSVNVRISTDRMPSHTVLTSFANQNFDMFDPDFSHWSFSDYGDTIVTIKDKEKKWVEKQISLYSDGYCRPFGLYSLTYNYEIQGRVKKG